MARSVKKRKTREPADEGGEPGGRAALMKQHKKSIAEDERLHKVVRKAMKKVQKHEAEEDD